MFYKGVFDKLGVKANIFRVGQYKSAVEPYFMDHMSQASREQVASFLHSIYDTYLAHVSQSRKIPIDTLHKISDLALVQSADDALKYKLVTGIAYEDQVLNTLGKAVKKSKLSKIEQTMVSMKTYAQIAKSKRTSKANKIAVLVAEGAIMDGRAPSFAQSKIIASKDFVKQIRKIREDDKIKAVVLRINSPGGSALASDIMWREIQLLKKAKPVIASMSDYAASGGYYMAMGCDQIVAQPNTITGSIGIFGIIFELEDFLQQKLGITTDRVTTGQHSDIMSQTRHITDSEKAIIQSSVNRGYEIFTSKAAKGRKISIDALKKVASGRVWTGKQALKHHLVDKIGGLEVAIKLAAKKAGIAQDEYMIQYYPKEKDIFLSLLNTINANASMDAQLRRQLGDLYPYYQSIQEVQKMQGIQARLPFVFVPK